MENNGILWGFIAICLFCIANLWLNCYNIHETNILKEKIESIDKFNLPVIDTMYIDAKVDSVYVISWKR